MPTATLTASISPNKAENPPKNGHGTPISLKLDTKIQQPGGTVYVLKSLEYDFPKGAVANGKLFPSCTVAKLNAKNGALSACPKGSKIGTGVATGTAVDLGITSTGKVTLFNGPGGKSIVVNVSVIRPALINASFSAPLKKTKGKYGYKLFLTVPGSLQEILDGPIVVKRIQSTANATIVKDGVKRGYIEGIKCPKSKKAPIHSQLNFVDSTTGTKASVPADGTIACR